MSLLSSGLGCDLCQKPIIDDPYWHITVQNKKFFGFYNRETGERIFNLKESGSFFE